MILRTARCCKKVRVDGAQTSTGDRAVVLGGGGLAGIAYLTGVIAALRGHGVRLEDADLILGTSAGAMVGTQAAAGMPFDRLYRTLAAHRSPLRAGLITAFTLMPTPDADEVRAMVEEWAVRNVAPSTAESRRLVARQAATGDGPRMRERVWVAMVAAYLRRRRWPAPNLAIAAVGTAAGEVRLLRHDDGVTPARAVAASAAVPGIFPPVQIDGRGYMDGGTRSTTNADLALGHRRVLLLVDHPPLADGEGPLTRACIDREVATLRASGAQVEVVEPDAAALQAIGARAFDPAGMKGAARAGRSQGEREAARIAALWG